MGTATRNKPISLRQPIDGAEVAGKVWSVDGAYKYCEQVARSHYENFPVGSALVPKHLRKHFYSIYAFARTADDFADEGYHIDYPEDERIALLNEWQRMLEESAAGRATHPIFVALAATRDMFNLPASLFEDLLSAFRQDVVTRRYESFEELVDYCRRSANPVGRLVLLLFGHRDEELHRWSDSICTALQLTNHWQDVAVDLDKDRIYLPVEDLARFALTEEDLKRRKADGRFKRLLEFEVARAREFFLRGKPLCVSVRGRLGLELRAVWSGGARILERIEENDYDVFSRRPILTRGDRVRILWASLRKGAFRRH